MTAQDREKFLAFTRRQFELESAVAHLRMEFETYKRGIELAVEPPPVFSESRFTIPPLPVTVPLAEATPASEESISNPEPVAATLPPLPVEAAAPEVLPAVSPIEPVTETSFTPPLLPSTPEPVTASEPVATAEDNQGGLEFQFGRWLARIGVVFALITLISFSTLAYQQYHHLMGPWSKLTVLMLISSGLVAAGLRLERKSPDLIVYGRTLAGGGLACLYYTIYGATYVAPLRVIDSSLVGGVLLLGWSAAVLFLAERKKSELLSVFAIALAYFSSAITPVGDFTMAANLILSVTAVIFLVRNAWTGLSYLCLAGTYFGSLRQLVEYDRFNEWLFVPARHVSFWPSATYLAGAWVIYTAAIFLARTPAFAAGKRLAFLCLNNGALVGLITLAAYASHFNHIGAILCISGGAFIATSLLARRSRAEEGEISQAYLIQGLGLVTGGITIAYAGVTRGLLITVESVFLAAAGTFARSTVMRFGAYLSSLLGVTFLLVEINPQAAHPWVLIAFGAISMLTNAWLARREFRNEARDLATQVFHAGAGYYVLLATFLLGFGILDTPLTDAWIGPVIALTTLVLTFFVYVVPLLELPLLIQFLLGFAWFKVLTPFDDSHAWWSELAVGLVTGILAAWWPRQKVVRTGAWLLPAQAGYALATALISICAVHPHVSQQGWMISSSLLALGFLTYGYLARTWPFAVAEQLLLGLSINEFFTTINGVFPWAWWAAAVPIAITYGTSWLVQEWMRRAKNLPEDGNARTLLHAGVIIYQAVTVALISRFIFGVVPGIEIPLAFFALGTLLMAWNLKWPSAMGVRYAMVFDVLGAGVYLSQVAFSGDNGSTWFNAAGLIFLLVQPGLLRRWGNTIITRFEMIGVTFLANLCTSVYVYWAIHPHVDEQGWMVATSLISLVYLAYGAWTRRWQFMLSGQVYLGISTWTFFASGTNSFPWIWWAAALPPAVFFITGWIGHRAFPRLFTLSEMARKSLRAVAYSYQIIALALFVRWIIGIVPDSQQTLAFFALATGIVIWNLRSRDAVGARAGLVMSLIGSVNYLVHVGPRNFNWSDAGAFALFLAQPALLRRWGRKLVTKEESWTLIIVSSAMGWLFVSNCVAAVRPQNLTLGWAIFALGLTALGFAAAERRQRWCGLGILLAAIIRVGFYDFWHWSDGYKVLTFFVLTVICLGLSFVYYRYADRLKKWL